MGRPPAPHAKKDDIMDAALRLFGEQGIRGTTIRDIATHAGVTSAALYRHFDSKLTLAQALFRDCAARLTRRLREADVPGDPLTRLCALTRALLEFSREEPDAFNYLLEHHHTELEGLPPEQELPKQIFEEVLAQGAQAGRLGPGDPALSASLLIGMCQRAVFFYDHGLLESTWDELTERVVEAAARVAR